jgi:aryl-alcohol dehydrogenase-like predicted oxidoreductase
MQFGWTADEEQSYQILTAAWEAGVNFIDTADIYSRWVEGNPGGVAETIIGNWMKKYRIPRGQVIIATKVRGRMGDGPNNEGLSRAHIFNAVEASLRRLGIETIDLYQAHWFDENTPIEETLRAFDDLIRQGKVRYIGCSNYPAWRLMQALWTSDKLGLASYISLQPHYNLVHRAEFERQLALVCRTFGIGVIPYSPLAGGFLTGKYRPNRTPNSVRADGVKRRYFTQKNWKLLDRMDTLAQAKSCSLSQLALAWLLSDPLI